MKKIFLLVTYFPTLFFSQGVYQDFGVWIKLNSNFKIDKKTSITNKTELRTFDNSQQINQIYTQFSYDKDLNEQISTSLLGDQNLSMMNFPMSIQIDFITTLPSKKVLQY